MQQQFPISISQKKKKKLLKLHLKMNMNKVTHLNNSFIIQQHFLYNCIQPLLLQVQHYLKTLKVTDAGFDDIPPHLLQNTTLYVDDALIHIINLCFKQGYFPTK